MSVKGRGLSGETRVKEMSFKMFSELAGGCFLFERVECSKEEMCNNKRNLKNVSLICELYGQRWGCEGT